MIQRIKYGVSPTPSPRRLLKSPSASPPPAFTPADLTGLVGWWDTTITASITRVGAAASAIADQSGSGNDLTKPAGSADSTYSATAFNGTKPGIAFSATTPQGFAKSSLVFAPSHTMTTFGTFISTGASGHDARIISYTGLGATHDFDNLASFGFFRGPGTADTVTFERNSVSQTVAFGDSVPHVVILTITNDGTRLVYIDGSVMSISHPPNGNFATPGFFGLGVSSNDTNLFTRWDGVFGEAGLTTDPVDATTAIVLYQYLFNKWL